MHAYVLHNKAKIEKWNSGDKMMLNRYKNKRWYYIKELRQNYAQDMRKNETKNPLQASYKVI